MPLTTSQPATGAWRARLARSTILAGAAVAALLLPGFGAGLSARAQSADSAQAISRAAQQSVEKARAAQARGDLRTAQIEYRNAVRADPDAGALRGLLAQISLDIGDTDTAEKEARAAIERKYEPAAMTALLLRSYLARGRAADLLRDFPLPTDPSTPSGVAAQIGLARVQASLAQGDRGGAKQEAEALSRVAPDTAEAHMGAAAVAAAEGDRARVNAEIDRALAVSPDNPDVLIRKASLQLEQNQRAEALATLDRLLARHPTMVQARIIRAEAYLRSGDLAKAREDVDAALRVSPSNIPALFQRAVLQTRTEDWRGADETLTRLGSAAAAIPDGLLLQATVKRALKQTEQAMDAAQRYVARRPEDPRGARLLAVMELEQRQPAAAAGTMERLIQRGHAEAADYDLLGRALMGAGRPREAAAAMRKVIDMAPNDAGAQTRLAAALLAAGDTAGTVQAAQAALRLAPDQVGARELLILASLARGDIATAEAEMPKIPEQARQSELVGVADATLRIAKLDLAGGRAGFEDVLKRYPQSIGARLGLARIAARSGDPVEAQRQLSEVLRIAPTNTEALTGLATVAIGGGPRAAEALAALEAAQKAAPAAPAPALTLANVLMRSGQAERALALLDSEGLRNGPLQRGAALHLMRSDANTLLQRWPEAEAAARTAFADDPDSSITRRALAFAMLRNGDARGAEELLQLGLRNKPADATLQQALMGVIQQARGLDAALAAASELAKQPDAQPAAALLRGELLINAGRAADAAKAFADAYAKTPTAQLAQFSALAWQRAGEPAKAVAALEAWLAKNPHDTAVLGLLAQFDMEAGRHDAAERRLAAVVEQAPTDAVAMNNLAWALAVRGGKDNLDRARGLAERAYFLFPSAEAADTLGWVLVKSGEPQRGLPLLREAVAARRIAASGQSGNVSPAVAASDAGMAYRLAYALKETGDKAAAISTLEPVLAGQVAFPERPEAERLMSSLRGG